MEQKFLNELNVFNNSILPSLHFNALLKITSTFMSHTSLRVFVTVADPETRQFITGKNREHL